MTLIEFLKMVMPDGNHFYTQHRASNGKLSSNVHHRSIATINTLGTRDEWYSMAAYAHESIEVITKNTATTKQRVKENIESIKCLWLDVDLKAKGNKPHYDNKADALASLMRLNPNIIVDSGNGYHAYWVLPKAVSLAEWEVLAQGLKASVMAYDPKLAADTSQWLNGQALLRLPGGNNYKTAPCNPVTATLITATPVPDHQIDALRGLARRAQPAALAVKPAKAVEYQGNEYRISYATLLTECNVLRQMALHPATVSEPEWYAALGVLRCTYEGDAAAQEFSKGHPGYDPETTAAKFAQAQAAVEGITTCTRLSETNPAHCTDCPKRGKGISPAGKVSLHSRNPSDMGVESALAEAEVNLEQQRNESDRLDALLAPVAAVVPPMPPMPITPPMPKPQPPKRAADADEAYLRLRAMIGNTKYSLKMDASTKTLSVSVNSGDKGSIDILQGCVFNVASLSVSNSNVRGLGALGDQIRFDVFTPDGVNVCSAEIPALLDARKVGSIFPEFGITISSPSHAAVFFNNLITSAKMKGVPTVSRYESLGWADSEGDYDSLPAFMCPSKIAIKDGIPLKADFAGQTVISHTRPDYDVEDPTSVSKALDTWVKANAQWGTLDTGLIAFSSAFASPFMSRFKIHSLLVHESGMAGCFKTTSIVAASSIWMHPEDSKTNMQGANGLTGRAEQLVHLPMFVDEITGESEDAVLKFLLMYSEGKSKDRRSGGGNYGLVKGAHWHNLCITTGNSSITYAVSKGGGSAEGCKRRYLEFECESPPLDVGEVFKQKLAAGDDANDRYWGLAGAFFMADVQKNWVAFKANYAANVAKVKAFTPHVGGTMDAQQRMIALVLTTSAWVKKLGLFDFDMDKLAAMYFDSLNAQATANRCSDDTATQELGTLYENIIGAATQANNAVAEITYMNGVGTNTSKGYCPELIWVNRYTPTRGIAMPAVIKVFDQRVTGSTADLAASAPVMTEVLILKSAIPIIARSMGMNARMLTRSLSPKTLDSKGAVVDDIGVTPTVMINATHISAGIDAHRGNSSVLPVDNRYATFSGEAYIRVMILPTKGESDGKAKPFCTKTG